MLIMIAEQAAGQRSGNHDSPNDTTLNELGFKLLVRWSLDVEQGEDAGDIEENEPGGKQSSGTLSVGWCHTE